VTLLALVATCISFTFINPFSHQSNLMVMGPGAYSTRTFAKFGVPLVVVSLATVSVVAWALLKQRLAEAQLTCPGNSRHRPFGGFLFSF
jgi:di/tricarboxylate transporter